MKKYILIITIILLLLWGCTYGYFKLSKPTTYTIDTLVPTESNESIIERKARELASMLLGDKTQQLKDDVVAQIQADESGMDFSSEDVFYTNDPSSVNYEKCRRTGGRRSINCDSWGPLQFKIPTIQHYYKTLYGEDISQQQALFVALDKGKATQLAEDIIFDVEGGIYEWSAADKRSEHYNTVVPFIRSLEK